MCTINGMTFRAPPCTLEIAALEILERSAVWSFSDMFLC